MSAADWYPDPTRPGRLRYWDGSSWTPHVSENGEVASDPISDVAPAPPRPDAAAGTGGAPEMGPATVGGGGPAVLDAGVAPTLGTRSARPRTAGALGGLQARGGPGGPTVLGRIGFAIAVAGGVLSAFSSGRVAVEQTEPFPATITVGGGAWIGLVAAVACLAGALAPWVWVRVTAIVVGWLGGAFIALAVIGFRTNEIFSEGGDLALGPAGVLMVTGALLLFAGSALALYGLRVPVTAPDPAAEAAPREGKGIAAMITGIVGLLILVPAPAAVALGMLAHDDDVASAGKVGARGMAMAGIVLGIVGMAGWALGLIIGMFVASP
jgi:hypothetical protein